LYWLVPACFAEAAPADATQRATQFAHMVHTLVRPVFAIPTFTAYRFT
jgi:hypothetical protein